MAKQGSFGAYSSVPTTTGLGQGAAQVFAPQAIPTDMSSIGQGLQQVGAAVGQMAIDKKKKEAEQMKLLQDLEKGETVKFRDAQRKAVDQFVNDWKTSDDPSYFEQNFTHLARQNEDLNMAEDVAVEQYKALKDDPNKKVPIQNEEGETVYVPAWQAIFNDLTVPVSEDESELLNEGLFAQSSIIDLKDKQGNVVQYDDKMDIQGSMLKEFYKFAPKSKWVRQQIESAGKDYDFKKIISEMPEEEMDKFIRAIKNPERPIYQQYERNYLVDNDIPPSALSDPDVKTEIIESFNADVEAAALNLPSMRKETGSVVKKPGDSGGSGALSVGELSDTDTEEIFLDQGFKEGKKVVYKTQEFPVEGATAEAINPIDESGQPVLDTTAKVDSDEEFPPLRGKIAKFGIENGKPVAYVEGKGGLVPVDYDKNKATIMNAFSTGDKDAKQLIPQVKEWRKRVQPEDAKLTPEEQKNVDKTAVLGLFNLANNDDTPQYAAVKKKFGIEPTGDTAKDFKTVNEELKKVYGTVTVDGKQKPVIELLPDNNQDYRINYPDGREETGNLKENWKFNAKDSEVLAEKLVEKLANIKPERYGQGNTAQGGYEIGQQEGGYEYTGGDPANPENWKKL